MTRSVTNETTNKAQTITSVLTEYFLSSKNSDFYNVSIGDYLSASQHSNLTRQISQCVLVD